MNRAGLILAAAWVALASPSNAREASPATVDEGSGMISSCINAAATAHRLPPSVIVILLNVEGGKLGAVSQNRRLLHRSTCVMPPKTYRTTESKIRRFLTLVDIITLVRSMGRRSHGLMDQT